MTIYTLAIQDSCFRAFVLHVRVDMPSAGVTSTIPTSAIFMHQIKRNPPDCCYKYININNDYVVVIILQLTLSRILSSLLCQRTALGRLVWPCRRVVTGTVSIIVSSGKAIVGVSTQKPIFTMAEMNNV